MWILYNILFLFERGKKKDKNKSVYNFTSISKEISWVCSLERNCCYNLFQLICKAIYTQIVKDKTCFEITVEDASINFQHVRDLNDVKWCLSKNFFPWAIKYYKNKPKLEEFQNIILTQKEIKAIQAELKLTKNQIKRVFEILKFAIADMGNLEIFLEYSEKVKNRLFLANKVEFLPFYKKKYPYLCIDDEVIKVPIEKFSEENLGKDEVDERLEEYWQELFDQYNAIIKKVRLHLDKLSQ